MATNASRFLHPKFIGLDSNGDPLVGGRLYTYEVGTTTNKTTWSVQDKAAANTNPIILDARGEASVFGDGSYKFELRDADDTLIWTEDNVDDVRTFNELTIATLTATTGTIATLTATTGTIDTLTATTGTITTLTAPTTTVDELRLREDTGNGSNYLALQAPASVTSDVTFTLPDGDGADGQVLGTNGSGTLEWTNVENRNLLMNGDFKVQQRGATFTSATSVANNDDTYFFDRWVLLSDGNDIVDLSTSGSAPPSDSYRHLQCDQETANKQYGILQILEFRDAAHIIHPTSGRASLSFKAKKREGNVTAGTIRAAVLSWSSTADSVTSDVVATWAGAGTDPTLAANWTYENTPSDIVLTNTWTTYSIKNIAIDTSSTANVAVFIWLDDTDATVGDFIDITDVKLESGAKATPYKPLLMVDDVAQCQRFFQSSYNQEVAPGTITNVGSYGYRTVSTVDTKYIGLRSSMRVAPTVTLYNPTAGSTGTWRNYSRSTNDAVAAANAGDNGFTINSSGHTASVDSVGGHWIADAEL